MTDRIEIYIAYVGIYVGAITFTIIFPFANEMVMSLGVTSDKDKTGAYVGLMATSLMFGRAISGLSWGYVIDCWGRKRVTQFSLVSAIVLCTVFGISNNYTYATFIRFLIGALTPIMISSRTILGDLCKGQEMSSAMAGTTIAWNVGSISGNFFGGVLANKEYINTQLGWVFTEYPFLLVNLVPVVISLVTLIVGFFYLRETLVTDQKLSKYRSRSLIQLLSDKKLFPLLIMHLILSYNSTGFQELIILFFWAKRESGGLEISTSQIGYISGGSISILLLFQRTAYMLLVNTIGNLLLCKYSLMVFPVLTILLPLSSIIENDHIRHICVVLLVIHWFLLDFFAYTAILVFSNNSVEQEEMGKFNGLIMTISCLGRMLSPITLGALFSYTIDSTLFYPLNYTSSFFLLVGVELLGLFYVRKIDLLCEKQNDELCVEEDKLIA
jgi:MFS family permease